VFHVKQEWARARGHGRRRGPAVAQCGFDGSRLWHSGWRAAPLFS